MAHFAELDTDNNVLRVVAVDNRDCMTPQGAENEDLGIVHLIRTFGGGIWKKASYSGSVRKNFPGPGYTYDAARDAFIPPRPYLSWVLDEATCRWVAPAPIPDDGDLCVWDETTVSWVVMGA